MSLIMTASDATEEVRLATQVVEEEAYLHPARNPVLVPSKPVRSQHEEPNRVLCDTRRDPSSENKNQACN